MYEDSGGGTGHSSKLGNITANQKYPMHGTLPPSNNKIVPDATDKIGLLHSRLTQDSDPNGYTNRNILSGVVTTPQGSYGVNAPTVSNWSHSFSYNSTPQLPSLSIINQGAEMLQHSNDTYFMGQTSLDIFNSDSFFNDTYADYYNTTNSTNSSSTETPEVSSPYSTAVIIVISLAVSILVVLTAGGNLLVLLSFKVDRTLHTISNYFLISLAVADTTIGIVSIPLYTLYLIQGYWPLGPIVCDIWLSLDYCMSNASVWNLFVICIDRYLSITRPLTYRANRTPKKAAMMIAGAWLISAVLWVPLIWIWPHVEGKRTVPDDQCYIQFINSENQDKVYSYIVNLSTSFLAFYGPVIIMCSLYFKIFLETRKRQKELATLTHSKNKSWKKKSTSSVLEDDVRNRHKISLSSQDFESIDCEDSRHHSKLYKFWKCCGIDRDTSDTFEDSSGGSDPPPRLLSSLLPTSTPPPSRSMSTSTARTKRAKFKRDCNSNHGNIHANGGPAVKKPSNLAFTNIPLITVNSNEIDSAPSSPKVLRTTSFSRSMPALDIQSEDSSSDEMDKDLLYSVLIKLPQDNRMEKASIKMFPPRYSRILEREEAGVISPITSNKRTVKENDCSSAITNTHKKGATVGRPANNTKNSMAHSRTYSVPHDTDHFPHANSARMAFLYKARMQQAKKKRFERKQDQKAAKTLSAILLAFILTWAPYNITVLLNTFRKGTVPSTSHFYSLGYMLCYINSTINPLCYALCNAQFRRTFWKILTCKCRRRPTPSLGMMVSRTRKSQIPNYRR